MKKHFLLISVLLIAVASMQISALETDVKNGSQSVPVDVVFTVEPFVRIGFAVSYVGSPVEPADDQKITGIGFKRNGSELVTDNFYLYAQAFTPDPVTISITEASPLKINNSEYAWTISLLPVGENISDSQIIESTSADKNKVLVAESGSEFKPRSYCWQTHATLSGDPALGTEIVSGSFSVKIASSE